VWPKPKEANAGSVTRMAVAHTDAFVAGAGALGGGFSSGGTGSPGAIGGEAGGNGTASSGGAGANHENGGGAGGAGYFGGGGGGSNGSAPGSGGGGGGGSSFGPTRSLFTTAMTGPSVTVTYTLAVATNKEQCKRGGWRELTDSNGTPFKNHGRCVGFVRHTTRSHLGGSALPVG
jgi:hypothetical protein